MSEGVYGARAPGRPTHGLLRQSNAMRSQAWGWAEGARLTPTQGEVLVLLMQRKAPCGPAKSCGRPPSPPRTPATSSAHCK